MDNKLSELSKPAAFIVRSPRGDVAYRTISQADADYIARKGYASEPLYSQEYVSALLAELEASKTNAEYYKSAFEEQRDHADMLEKRLATSVQLPDVLFIKVSGSAVPVMHATRVKERIRAAGFTVGDE